MATEALFSQRARLVVDASHVAGVVHDGLSLVPLAEIFQRPDHPVLGFGVPNVYLTVSTDDGRGWEKFAATMFFRQPSRVVDTRGRVQGGVLLEVRVIRTRRRRVSDHFRSVLSKDALSPGRLALKLVRQVRPGGRRPVDRAPVLEPRPLGPATSTGQAVTAGTGCCTTGFGPTRERSMR